MLRQRRSASSRLMQMRIVPPPPSGSLEALFSDHESVLRILPLLDHPLVRRINRHYKPWRAAAPMARAEGLEPLDVWRAAKLQRFSGSRLLPLARAEGGSFRFTETPVTREQLHRIDQTLGGGGPAAFESSRGLVSDPALRVRFAIRSMMEEAIESSRIEGAVTTRSDALDLLRSGREPQSKYERMVVNNYAAMQSMKKWLGDDLTIERLHSLQRTVTRDTLDDPGQAGRFRRPDEPVRIVDA